MLTRRPARPGPPPKTEGAKRLEYVRTEEGIPSLRGFWAKLGGKASGFSYEAMRNYHYDRQAPTGYLIRVTKVFPLYSLAYLAGESAHPTEAHAQTSTTAALASEPPTADGPDGTRGPTSAERRREDAQRTIYHILDAVGVPQPGGMDLLYWRSPQSHVPYWAAALSELRRRVWWSHMMKTDPTLMHEDTGAAEAWIGAALRGPIEAFGIDPAQMDEEVFGEYITAIMPALLRLAEEMKSSQQRPLTLAAGRGRNEVTDAAQFPPAPVAGKRRTDKPTRKAPAKKSNHSRRRRNIEGTGKGAPAKNRRRRA